MPKLFESGVVVKVTQGKHMGKVGTVAHSDKSITTVKFGDVVEPVWTVNLVLVETIECTICRRDVSASEYYGKHINVHPCE